MISSMSTHHSNLANKQTYNPQALKHYCLLKLKFMFNHREVAKKRQKNITCYAKVLFVRMYGETCVLYKCNAPDYA